MIGGERTLPYLLRDFAPHLADPETTEIVVVPSGRIGVERAGVWTWHDAPNLDFAALDAIAILAAGMTGKNVSPTSPSCSSRLPTGERITIARPPMVPEGTVSFTIRRRADSFRPTLEWLSERGYFSKLSPTVDWVAYFRDAVAPAKPSNRKTIMLGGATGSSKTSFAEALIRAIPLHERIVTIESTPEWRGFEHLNWQPLYYGTVRTAAECLEETLRMRPDRVLMGEVRTGAEAWGFLRALLSGHPGGISTVHCESASDSISTLAGMLRQDVAGSTVPADEAKALLRRHLHILVHCARVHGDPVPYHITDVVETERPNDMVGLRRVE